jgi:hypothetical protein
MRNPTAKPMAVVTASPKASSTDSASTRPPSSAVRDTGSDRSRSVIPRSRSSATPEAALLPVNRTLVTT